MALVSIHEGTEAEFQNSYRLYRAEKTNSHIPSIAAYFIIFNVVFSFSDRFLRHIPFITKGRVIPTLFAIVLIYLYLKKVLKPIPLKNLREIWHLSAIVMFYWIAYMLYDTDTYSTSIMALLFTHFAVAITGVSTTKKLALQYFVPMLLFIGGVLLTHPADKRLGQIANVFAFAVVCLILNQLRERLSFSEFKLKRQLEDSLDELKTTQAQLVQSEKMASLVEVTAGIAHEIQNPLNFVNNFSEVSIDLVDEMNAEFQKGNSEDGLLIAQDLKQNLGKINHHGKRAGEIVKGMLQHTRQTTGRKELTNINSLTDEYLRISYQAVRTKDESFHATIETHFDKDTGDINIIAPDIGRVMMNIFNNAFYSLSKKRKTSSDNSYQPLIKVGTARHNGNVTITVYDNGNGMPEKIRDKIYQPFFTTKPTGEGTGLGLSLSYDIITKTHGGKMEAITEEGKFAEFIITIPV